MSDHVESGFAQLRKEAAAGSVDELVARYQPMLAGLRRVFESGRTKDLRWRRRQLQAVQEMVEQNHEAITAAVRADLGGPKLRGIGELGAHAAAQFALDNLDEWTKTEVVHTPFQLSPTRMAKSFIRQEAKGVALVISPWNYPFELALHPIVSALAAGCCVVLKPSEISSASAALMGELIPKYLDRDCVKVVQGAVNETVALLKQHWDHIFYTGSGDVGKKVMHAAAEHLTSVTLELGGKSPCIIDTSAKMDTVCDRVFLAKFMNAGQTCVAPDFFLVHNTIKDAFIDGMKKRVEKHFPDPKKSKDWGRIVSENHTRRVKGLIEEAKGTVVFGGAGEVDVGERYVPPTLIDSPAPDSVILKQEIFGPVMPVIGVDSVDDAIARANQVCDRPLALYCFAEDAAVVSRVLDNTLSGGCAINTALEQLLTPYLPFGGVGGSGCGQYHGKYGFDEFTHRRSCLKADTLIKRDAAMPPPPSNDKIYDFVVRATVTGFLPKPVRPLVKPALYLALAAAAWVGFSYLF